MQWYSTLLQKPPRLEHMLYQVQHHQHPARAHPPPFTACHRPPLNATAATIELTPTNIGVSGKRLAKIRTNTEEMPTIQPRQFILALGGGKYMFWQLGVLDGLNRHTTSLCNTHFIGSSSGALAAALVACGVDVQHALNRAAAMARAHGLFGRRRGLAGAAPLLQQWVADLITPQQVEQHGHRIQVCGRNERGGC